MALILGKVENQRLKKVKIDWSYPKKLDNMWNDERLNDYGVYYISSKYKDKEKFLYIGQTYDSFYNRLVSHDFNWLNEYKGEKYIRLGYITYPPSINGDEAKKKIIKAVEAALIFDMRDIVENISGISSYTPEYWIKINNTGYRGELRETISMWEHIK